MNLLSLAVSFIAFMVWMFSSGAYVTEGTKKTTQASSAAAGSTDSEATAQTEVVKEMGRDEVKLFQETNKYLTGEYVYSSKNDPTPFYYDMQIVMYNIPEGTLEQAGYFADIFVTYNVGTKVGVGYRGNVILKNKEYFTIVNINPMSDDYVKKYGKNAINVWRNISYDVPEILDFKLNKQRKWEINHSNGWANIKGLMTTITPEYEKFYGTWKGKIGEKNGTIIIEKSNNVFPKVTYRWANGGLVMPCKNTSAMMRLMKDTKFGFFGGEHTDDSESWTGCGYAFSLGMMTPENKMQVLDYTYSDDGEKGELTRQ